MSNQDRQQEQAITPTKSDSVGSKADSWPNEAVEGSTKQKMKEDARDVKHEVASQVREKAETGQRRIAEGAGALSDAIDAAAAHLDEHDRNGLARYAREMSSKLSDAAGQLEGRSVDELAEDAKRLARDNPALFMLGSVVIGFALSRFFKASDNHDQHKAYGSDQAYAAKHSNADATGTPPMRRPDNGMAESYMSPSVTRSSNGSNPL